MSQKDDIIRRPVITEKATWQKEKSNKYVFEVSKDCNKIEIKSAIERLFGVTVKNIQTSTTHGKIRSRGRFSGKRPDWKRAIVQLKDGDTIEFFEGV
ncbi:MAG: 50S ribosomal protein L23 [Candidatus Latescibacteria bacterium]|nr:50S ribosomal protein L23 [Candidatus Latescibacterota bacterium]